MTTHKPGAECESWGEGSVLHPVSSSDSGIRPVIGETEEAASEFEVPEGKIRRRIQEEQSEEEVRRERVERAQEELREKMKRRREGGVASEAENEEAEEAETAEARAEAEAKEMFEAEITLEMEEVSEGTFEARCEQHGITPARGLSDVED